MSDDRRDDFVPWFLLGLVGVSGLAFLAFLAFLLVLTKGV